MVSFSLTKNDIMLIQLTKGLLWALIAFFVSHGQLRSQVLISTIPYQGRVEVDGVPFTGTGQFNFMLVSKNPFTTTPTAATASVTTLDNGGIEFISISNFGSGYTSTPTISFSGGGGTGASATALISLSTGTLTGITITAPGENYTSPPTITISPPQPAETATWSNESATPFSTARPASFETLPVTNGIYSVQLGDFTTMPPILQNNLRSLNISLRVWFSDGVNGFQLLTPDQPLGATPYTHIARTVLGFGSIASGENTTAMGFFSTASGANSTAMGDSTTASGPESTAMGDGTTASGNNSTAMGFETIASGGNAVAGGFRSRATNGEATAFGDATTASGNNSTAMGLLTVASGRNSTAMGNRTIAPSFTETSLGLNNTDYIPLGIDNFDINDRLFSIGNGASSSNRSDALTMLKSGQTEARAASLSTDESSPSNFAWLIENTASTGDVLSLRAADATVTTDSKFISFFSGSDTVLGEIEGNGAGGVTYRSFGADYAELLLPHDESESFEPGDVVAVHGGKITKDTSKAEQIMVISTNPIVLGNSPPEGDDQYQKVAFIGQAPVKVIGAVQSGDYLLASTQHNGSAIAKPASALTLSDRNLILGRAWEGNQEEGEKLVNAAVGLDLGPALVSEIQHMHRRIQELESMESRLIKMEEQLRLFNEIKNTQAALGADE